MTWMTRLTCGRVFVAGRDITTMSNQHLARLRVGEVGFAFQAYNCLLCSPRSRVSKTRVRASSLEDNNRRAKR